MQPLRGKVPHFTMRPHPALLGAFVLVLAVGFLLSFSMFAQDEGAGDFKQRGILILVITGVISGCLLILMTSKMWFKHLWKRNSTHARHKQHTQYHPSMRDRDLPSRRDRGRR